MDSYSENKTNERKFLFWLTFRAFLFLSLMLVVLTLFYVMGNFQQFLDSTQHFILLLSSIVSIALLFFSFAGLIESIFYLITLKQKKYIFFIILFIVTLIAVSLLLLLLRTITFISSGL